MANARIPLRMWVVCALVVVLPVSLPAEIADDSMSGFTAPSKDLTLSFTQAGRISSLKVKEGDIVEAGRQLVQLDDAMEIAQLKQLEAESKDTTQIEAREAELKQKQVDLEKFERAAAQNAVSPLEIEHARVDATIGEMAVKIAKFQHDQSQLKYEEGRIRVETMKLNSPIACRVEKIHAREGESVEAGAEVVRVVEIDPLWVDVPVQLATAQRLKEGQVARVQFSGQTSDGKIIFIAGVATDPASGTLTVRVEVPNQSRRPAGEKVIVTFPQGGDLQVPAGEL